MFHGSKFAMLLWLLAVALLPVRMANAHLHLCLDGQAPPVSVHVEDLATHDGNPVSEDGHTDRDLDVSQSLAFAKATNLNDFSPAILGAYVLAILAPAQIHVAPRSVLLSPDLTPAFDLRPPPRGPPA